MVIVSVAVIALILSIVCIVLVFTKSSDNDEGKLDRLEEKYEEMKSILCSSTLSIQIYMYLLQLHYSMFQAKPLNCTQK